MTKIKDPLVVLKRLNHFTQTVGNAATIEDLAATVSIVLDDLLEIESSGLYLYDFNEKRLKLLIAKGFSEEERAEADMTAMERHPGFVFRTGETLDIPDTEDDRSNLTITSNRGFIVRSRLYFPVLSGKKPVGAFGIVSSRPNRFNEEYKLILSFICSIAGGVYANIMHNAKQKQDHDRLAAITVRLETLIKNLRSGILVEDQDRKIALVNGLFCQMFGIPVDPEFLPGSDCSDSAEQTKSMFEEPEEFVDRINLILREKKPVTGEVIALADGRTFERAYIPIFLDGQFLGNLWEYKDVTVREQKEKDLRHAMDEAKAANSAKSIFLANMSHEIRTPLNAVIGLSRLMRDTHLSAEQKLLNEKLLISGENLLVIINEILDFSKIEAGRIEIENIPFNPETVLKRVYSFLSPAAEEKTIILSASMDRAFPKAVVGDPNRLQQVLINLVNNAIKFTSAGSVNLSCTCTGEAGGKAEFMFSVSDTGIGISEENLKNIFEKFKQEDESVTRIYGGTGLGLAISRQLVGLMGGDLKVESEKGSGSRFFFTLEFETTDAAVLAEVNRKIRIDQKALRGKHILVVEDNEFNQFIARSILEKWNIRTELASNGQEAIEKVGSGKYDLILMDMQMPIMDGFTAARIIRDDLKLVTPVIALTAFATKEAVARTLEAGMSGYITKPFDEETLFGQLMTTFGIPVQYQTDEDIAALAASSRPYHHELQYDLDKLSKLLSDDQAEIINLIEKFIEVTPALAGDLVEAYDRDSIVDVAKAAHKIKSSLELLASRNLRSNINLIHEYSATESNLEKLPKLLRYFKANIPVLLHQLREKVNDMKKATGTL